MGSARRPAGMAALTLVGVGLPLFSALRAQSPSVVTNVPAQSFGGEQFCFTATLSNSGPPGFGPFLRLILDPGLSFDSSSFLGASVNSSIVGTFPGGPGNQLIDPISGGFVAGPAGGSLIILQPPLGSVVTNGPPLPVGVCLSIDLAAAVGTPLDVAAVPVYRFGDTATGDNGPIVGSMASRSVTPILALFSKSLDAPEGERPPASGQGRFPVTYSLVADIAAGRTLTNLIFSDTLPSNLQFDGSLSINGGVGCVPDQVPSTMSPGGTLRVTCSQVVGSAAPDDISVRYEAHAIDLLDEASCASSQLQNASAFDAQFFFSPIPQQTASAPLQVKHVALQKSVSTSTAVPGDTVSYTLDFQVSDFATAQSLEIVDVLGDGLQFIPGSASLDVGGAMPIIPGVEADTPGLGQTRLRFDVADALGAVVAAGTSGAIVFQARVLQSFATPAAGNATGAVLAGDLLPNDADALYALSAGASGCADDTSEGVAIVPVAFSKSILSPNPQFVPGDSATFLVRLDIPSGDTEDIVFEDFFPLPVFDVTRINPTFGVGIRFNAADTLGLAPTLIQVDAATNSLRLEFPDASTALPQVLAIEVDIEVTDDPFADGLFLTNLVRGSTNNSQDAAASDLLARSINVVRAPNLLITKGISASSNPNASVVPAVSSPVDGDASATDAGDRLTYVITVENIGGADAFEVTISESLAPELQGCSLSSVRNGNGTPLAFTGDLLSTPIVLTDPLEENDESPPGGGAPFSNDTAVVTFECTVSGLIEPNQTVVNTASVGWKSSSAASSFFPSRSDAASFQVSLPTIVKSIAAISPIDAGGNQVHIGEIVTYQVVVTLPEGTSRNVELRDQLDPGLAFFSLDSISAPVNVTTDQAGGFPAVAAAALIQDASAAAVDGGRILFLDLGRLTNADGDDSAAETVTIRYRVVVLNSGGNNRGTTLSNRAEWSLDDPAGGRTSIQDSAPDLIVVEPTLQSGKIINPISGDAGDVLTVTLTVSHRVGSNADAFDVRIEDILPALLNFDGFVGSGLGLCDEAPDGGLPSENAGVVSAFWSSFRQGRSCQIVFQVRIDAAAGAGTSIDNTASLNWSSHPTDSSLAQSPFNSISNERTGNPADAGGSANDHADSVTASIAIDSVTIAKSVDVTSEAATNTARLDPLMTDLAIGEQVEFLLTVTLPEGQSSQLIVTDALPISPGVLSVVSASVVRVGDGVGPSNIDVLPGDFSIGIQDNNLGDGLDDTVVFSAPGAVNNTADGISDADDQIVFRVVAVVADDSANVNGDRLTNTASVQFGPGLDGSATAQVELVEPRLRISKTGDVSTGEAGDIVTYTIEINHEPTSQADAFDLELTDVLPADVTFLDFPLAAGGNGIGACDDAPDRGPSESGGTVSAGWDAFPLGSGGTSCEIILRVILDPSVVPGQTISNRAEIAFTSLENPGAEERSSSESSDFDLLITDPGVTKSIVATSQASTGSINSPPISNPNRKSASEDLAIGEQVTFRITVDFIDGTTPNASFRDQLPTSGVVLELVSSRILSIGADLTVPDAVLGEAGDDCLPADCDSDLNGVRDVALWNLGSVVNAPDGDADPDPDDQIEFEVAAVVKDDANNQGQPGTDQNLANLATLSSDSGDVSDMASFDIVEPRLQISKTPVCIDSDQNGLCEMGEPFPAAVEGGQRIVFEVEVRHSGNSTSQAFGLSLIDRLPTNPGTAFVPGSVTAVSGPPPDLVTNNPFPGSDPATVEFGWSEPDDDLPLGTVYAFRYSVIVGDTVPAAADLANRIDADYRSTPIVVAESRSRSEMASAMLMVNTPNLSKSVVSTSLSETSAGVHDPALEDAAIGEEITYAVTAVFPPNTNTLATTIADSVPAGRMEIIGASFMVDGDLTTGLSPPVPSLPSDSVSFDFGSVANNSMSMPATITVTIVARVLDNPANVGLPAGSPSLLDNSASLTFSGGSDSDSSRVEIVEPDVAVSKTFAAVQDSRVSLTIALTNNGTGPAFDLQVSDALDESIWSALSATAEAIPAGFQLAQMSAGGLTTVTITPSGDPSAPSPDQILSPGESISFTFSAEIRGGASPPATTVPNTADVSLSSLPGVNPVERSRTPSAGATLLLPLLTAAKTVSPSPASPGQEVTYTVTVTNSGDGPAPNVTVSDVPDSQGVFQVGSVSAPGGSVVVGNTAGDVSVEAGFASIGAGNSVVVSYRVLVPDPLGAGIESFSNQAQIDSDPLPPSLSDDSDNPASNSDPTVLPITAAPDLEVLKDDASDSVLPGGTIVYDLTVRNNGNQEATGVTLSEAVPANMTFNPAASSPGWLCLPNGGAGSSCTLALGALAGGGARVDAAFAVDLSPAPLPAGLDRIDNSVSVADDGSNGADADPADNSASDSTVVLAEPILQVSKSDGGLAFAVPGQTVRYSISFSNLGDQGASGVALTETVPLHTVFNAAAGTSGWSCADGSVGGTDCGFDIGTLAGASSPAPLIFAVNVVSPASSGATQLLNSVTIGDDGANGGAPSTDSDLTATPLLANPDLRLVKSDSGINGLPGGLVSYALTFSNLGDQDATGVVLSETVPDHTSFNPEASAPGWNCAGVSPGSLCTLDVGSLAAGGASLTVSFAVAIDNPLAAGVEQIANAASIADDGANGADDNPADNSDSDLTPILANAAISISKRDHLEVDADANSTPSPGDTLRYTATVTNSGDQDAASVVFDDPLDGNLILVPGSVQTTPSGLPLLSGGSVDDASVSIDIGTLAGGGGAVVIEFLAVVRSPLPVGVLSVSNQAAVSSDQPPVASDDPDTPARPDPTITVLEAVPLITAAKTDSLLTDADQDMQPSPGDILRYSVTLANVGNIAASGVMFDDVIGAHVRLLPGSVTVSPPTSGNVTQGNSPGDAAVQVEIGTLAGNGGIVSIGFDVIVDDPVPEGVDEVVNQGRVSSNELPEVLTDDPDGNGVADPTVTPLNSAPALSAVKTDALIDADGNGFPSPGDTLRYTIVVRNDGNESVTTAVMSDSVDTSHVTLVPGTATTSQGTVLSGNGLGETSVDVALGTLVGGTSATIVFDVTINSPLAAGQTEILNQATISCDQFPDLRSDDPDQPGAADPTRTVAMADPVLNAEKTVVLETDADGDSIPTPGDRLRYAITISNSGNAAAGGVALDDAPDANSSLIADSISISQGTVVSGDSPGDAELSVALGSIGPGASATVAFSVTINNPLPLFTREISNQGTVSSDELPPFSSDDPGQPGLSDPTVIAVSASPKFLVEKTASLFEDADNSGFPSPGDTLLYTIRVSNIGDIADPGPTLTDAIGPNLTLLPGVTVDQGIVLSGDSAGDSSAAVRFNTLNGGESFTASFRARIDSPLPAGVVRVSNQALLTPLGLPAQPSDDPQQPGAADPTETMVQATPSIAVSKSDSLFEDADSDGRASSGDILLYTVVLVNSGNADASGVVFSDLLEPNAGLVAGSVESDSGSVLEGIDPGDESVGVAVGTLSGGGGTAAIRFRVRIADPLPEGVAFIRNQGVVSSDQLPAVLSDDPETLAVGDPTRTAVADGPALSASKTVHLEIDADGDGFPSPGDVLAYLVTVVNNGNQDAPALFEDDPLDANLELLTVLSVMTSQGTILKGDGEFDQGVLVDLGSVAAGSQATVSFRARIDDPFPDSVASVFNQGRILSEAQPPVLTDDPTLPGESDPNITMVSALPQLSLSKSDSLLVDSDGDGLPSAGDTILYSLRLVNSGRAGATSVVLRDALDANTALVSGSVSSSLGTVTRGNGADDAEVEVEIGAVPGQSDVSLSFRATIADPLPSGVNLVANQAAVDSQELPTLLSDDPELPADSDPTVTPVSPAPLLLASKRDSLLLDADANGAPSPGDTVLYTLTIVNIGGASAAGAVLRDVPDSRTQLEAQSVRTSQGTVRLGNSLGDESIEVELATIPPGKTVTVTFRVRIDADLAADVSEIVNQGIVEGAGLPPVLSDDPDQPGIQDPTITRIDSQPSLRVSKRDALAVDLDQSGTVTPGDSLRYTLLIVNEGRSDANGVVLTDRPDPNAPLSVASVETTRGSVLSGNGPGDREVIVDLGVVEAGSAEEVSFLVRIDDPLPAGVDRVRNQAIVSSLEFPSVLSDDPDVKGQQDPTDTRLFLTPSLTVSKTDSLLQDVDGDGFPSPGDRLRYDLEIRNQGSAAASGVRLSDTPDLNTRLVSGSVEISQGNVESGDEFGDAGLAVQLGVIAAGQAATVRFEVEIVSPLSADVGAVRNQALVSSDQLPSLLSDDPDRPGPNDPTETPIRAEPVIVSSKSDSLQVDADQDGEISPGDTLLYAVRLFNLGNAPAEGVIFEDSPDPHTQLVAGSVIVSQGGVLEGNGTGDHVIRADLETIEAGGSASVSYLAVIDNPLPDGLELLLNQGTVVVDGLEDGATDDPRIEGPSDPTSTQISGSVVLHAAKTDALSVDADASGAPSPGDVLSYIVTVSNFGALPASGVVFDDALDASIALVAGSVRSDRGTIEQGNGAGDRQVRVDLGTLPSGHQAVISFQAQIRSNIGVGVTVLNQATVRADGIPPLLSDDPDLPGRQDPTETLVQVPEGLETIPLLSPLGALAMAGLLTLWAVYRLRRPRGLLER